MDAKLARKLHMIFQEKLKAENLLDLYELEVGLLRLYHDMRKRGVRVSEERAVKLRDSWRGGVANEIKLIKDKTGFEVDIWSAESLGKALRHENIPLAFTEKTHKISITSDYLKGTDHWLAKAILRARELDKLAETFIDSAILGHVHNGRVHTELHPLRRNDNEDVGLKGTITGRMSSANPNLQQVPTRSEVGNQLRTIFIPEDGEKWVSLDYSQQEPRLTVHWAATRLMNGKALTGSAEAVKKYQDDPKMSYHLMVAEQTGLPYKSAKILNLALTYGRGAASTARELGCSVDEAKRFIAQYHARLPFVKELDAVLNGDVAKNGYVTTLLNRKCRFTLFEPADWALAQTATPVPYWKAKKLWPNQKLRLAGLHKKLNRVIQGSAADQTKKAMKLMYDLGLGKHLVFPIHDEVCGSTPSLEITTKLRNCMRDAIPLKVPVLVTVKDGPDWGTLTEVEM
jgi:DNA polymerase-1